MSASPDDFERDMAASVMPRQSRAEVEAEVRQRKGALDSAATKADRLSSAWAGTVRRPAPHRDSFESDMAAAIQPAAPRRSTARITTLTFTPASPAQLGASDTAQPAERAARIDLTGPALDTRTSWTQKPRTFHDQAIARGATQPADTSGVNAGYGQLMAAPPGGTSAPVGGPGPGNVRQATATIADIEREGRARNRQARSEALRKQGTTSAPVQAVENLLAGAGETGASLGRIAARTHPLAPVLEYFRPGTMTQVDEIGREMIDTAQDVTARNEPGFVNDLAYEGGRILPKLIAPGGPIGFGAVEAADVLGHGGSAGEAAQAGITGAATAKLGGALASKFQRAAAGPLEAYGERVAGNLIAPMVIQGAQGEAPSLERLPKDLAFAAAFGLPGGGEQAQRRQGVMQQRADVRATVAPPKRLALNPAPPEALARTPIGPFEVGPNGDVVDVRRSPVNPRLEPIPTQGVPLNRYQRRAQDARDVQQEVVNDSTRLGIRGVPDIRPNNSRVRLQNDSLGRAEAPQEGRSVAPVIEAAPIIAPTVTTVKPTVSVDRSVKPESDTLLSAIQKLGFDSTTPEGSDLARYLNVKEGGRPGMVNNQRLAGGSKRGIDELITALQEHGWDIQDKNDLMEAVRFEQRGKPVHSNGYDHAAHAETELASVAQEHPVMRSEAQKARALLADDSLSNVIDKIHGGEYTETDWKEFEDAARYKHTLSDETIDGIRDEAEANKRQRLLDSERTAESGTQEGEQGISQSQRSAVRDAAAQEGDVNGNLASPDRFGKATSGAGLIRNVEQPTIGNALGNQVATRGPNAASSDQLSRVAGILESLKQESKESGVSLSRLVEDRINQQSLPGMSQASLTATDAAMLRDLAGKKAPRKPTGAQQQGFEGLDVNPTLESKAAEAKQVEAAQSTALANSPLFENVKSDVIDRRYAKAYQQYKKATPNQATDYVDFNGIKIYKLEAIPDSVSTTAIRAGGKEPGAYTDGKSIFIPEGVSPREFQRIVEHELDHIERQDNPSLDEEHPEFAEHYKAELANVKERRTQSEAMANSPLFEGIQETPHHSELQPRNEAGQFDGPPLAERKGGTGKKAQPNAANLEFYRNEDGDLSIRAAYKHPTEDYTIAGFGEAAERIRQEVESLGKGNGFVDEYGEPLTVEDVVDRAHKIADLYDDGYSKIDRQAVEDYVRGKRGDLPEGVVRYNGVAVFKVPDLQTWKDEYLPRLKEMGYDEHDPDLKIWAVKGEELPTYIGEKSEAIVKPSDALDITNEALGEEFASLKSTQTASSPATHPSQLQPRDVDTGKFTLAPEKIKAPARTVEGKAISLLHKDVAGNFFNDPAVKRALGIDEAASQSAVHKALQEAIGNTRPDTHEASLLQGGIEGIKQWATANNLPAETVAKIDRAVENAKLGGRVDDPEIIQRYRAELGKKSGDLSGTLLSDPERGYKAAVVLGHDLYRSAKDFGVWSRQMVQRMGEAVRPMLRRAWDEVRSIYTEHIKPVAGGRPSERGTVNIGAIARTVYNPKQAGTITPATEAISTLRKAGLLTSVKTHLRNVLGTGAFQVAEEISRIPGSVLDLLASTVTKQRGLTGPSMAATGRAGYEAATKGVSEAMKIMRQGTPSNNPAQVHAELNTKSPLLNAYANTVFRALSAEDKVMRVYAYRRALEGRAKAEALNEKRSNPSVDVKARTSQLVTAPHVRLMAESLADAEMATFNNDNAWSTAIQNTRQSLKQSGSAGKATDFAIDMIMPFDRTPTNIMARLLEYTPGGAVYGLSKTAYHAAASRLTGKAFTPAEQLQFARTFGRGMTGSALIALGYALAASGHVTGVYDEDDKAGNRYNKEAGRSPMAIKIGDKWLQIGGFSPLGNLLAIGATLFEKPDTSKTLIAKEALTEQPMLRGLNDLMSATKSGDKLMDKAGYMAGSFIPTAVSDIAEATDNKSRKTFGFEGQIKKKIPGLRQQLEPDEGVQHSRAWSVDPFHTTTEDPSYSVGALAAKKAAGKNFTPDPSKPFTAEDKAARTAKQEFVDLVRAKKGPEAIAKAEAMLAAGAVSEKELQAAYSRAKFSDDAPFDLSRAKFEDMLDIVGDKELMDTFKPEQRKQVLKVALDRIDRLNEASYRPADFQRVKSKALQTLVSNLDEMVKAELIQEADAPLIRKAAQRK